MLFLLSLDVGIMDFVNSTTFIKRPPCMTDIQEKFLYTKELLTGRIFLGSYLEKRYVTVLNEYRNVVFINSDETDLQHDLDKIKRKWLGVSEIKWLGITGPDDFGFPRGYCFWVKFTNLAIGQYWFQIKHVKLVDKEIVFQLKCIRKSKTPLHPNSQENSEKPISEGKQKSEASTSIQTSPTVVTADFEPQKAFLTLQETCVDALHTIRPFLTIRNISTVIRVGCAFTVVFIMGIISLIGHLGEFILKLLREFTLLVNAFTPIVIQLIDFLSKIIGGLFILVAGMFRNGNFNVNVQPYRNQILYNTSIAGKTKTPSQTHVDWRERNRILRQELFSDSFKRK